MAGRLLTLKFYFSHIIPCKAELNGKAWRKRKLKMSQDIKCQNSDNKRLTEAERNHSCAQNDPSSKLKLFSVVIKLNHSINSPPDCPR